MRLRELDSRFLKGLLVFAPQSDKQDSKLVLPLTVIAPALFAAGATVAYFVIRPLQMDYFLGASALYGLEASRIAVEGRAGDYFDPVTPWIFTLGLAFEFPLLLALFWRTGTSRKSGLDDGPTHAAATGSV